MPLHLPKRFCLFILIVTLPSLAYTQKSKSEEKENAKYKEEAEAIRKEVWAWSKPEFNVRNIPTEYANASKVIIARHQEVNSESKQRYNLMTGLNRELMLLEIGREAIKLNDKVAVTEYSELSFTQIKKPYAFYLASTTKMYIGVRVFKPDGSMKEMNYDDIVLTQNTKDKKEAKLAIPDLQVGDIIDYFIAKQQNRSQLSATELAGYTFTLFDEAPIMHYFIHFEIGKKYSVEYRCYNGAPDFKRTTGENDDRVLDIVQKNVPAFAANDFWTSPYRQLPIIRMSIQAGTVGRQNLRKPGEIYKNPSADDYLKEKKDLISDYKKANYQYKLDMGIIRDYYQNVIKNKNNMTPDSLLRELYYMYRFRVLLDVGTGDFESVINRHDLSYDPDILAFNFGYFLQDADVESKLVLLTTRLQPVLAEIMNSDEISILLATQKPSAAVFSFVNMYAPFATIPAYFENTKQAVTLDIKGKREFNIKDFDEGKMDLPGTTADKNGRIENLAISLSADGTTLSVDRIATLRGHYKREVQKQLILFEDLHAAERKLFGVQQTLLEQMTQDKRTQKFGEELHTAFEKARIKNKEAFITDAKEWFEQEITEFRDQKILNMGVRHTNPDFVYSSKFKLGGLVKKAGNNYIIDIGKVQGSPLKIENDQRKRTLDIYAPFPRSFEFNISFQIPPGFAIEGVKELNRKVENETGYFIAEANTDGKTVTIKVKKSYHHAFEPSANWEKLLAFIDAANDWTNVKILLKKL